MGDPFVEYRETNPRKEFKEGDFPAWLDDSNGLRSFFIMVGMPFFVTKVRDNVGSYGPQLWYDIKVDTSSLVYQQALKTVSVDSEYTLSLPGSDDRKKQIEQLFKEYIIPNHVAVKLVKDGKAFDFRLA